MTDKQLGILIDSIAMRLDLAIQETEEQLISLGIKRESTRMHLPMLPICGRGLIGTCEDDSHFYDSESYHLRAVDPIVAVLHWLRDQTITLKDIRFATDEE